MKHIKMKYGFTLIELLVVVIIIAVLSAVAVPMYKHAALKSRFSKVMPVAKSIVEAQEVYYLGKNIYAANDEKDLLDVAPSGATTIELATRDQENQYNYVAASSTEVPGARYIMYQKHSPKFADTIQCEADENNLEAVWLCSKGLNGQLIDGSVNTAQGSYVTYLLSGTKKEGDTLPTSIEKVAKSVCDENAGCTYTISDSDGDGKLDTITTKECSGDENTTAGQVCIYQTYDDAGIPTTYESQKRTCSRTSGFYSVVSCNIQVTDKNGTFLRRENEACHIYANAQFVDGKCQLTQGSTLNNSSVYYTFSVTGEDGYTREKRYTCMGALNENGECSVMKISRYDSGDQKPTGYVFDLVCEYPVCIKANASNSYWWDGPAHNTETRVSYDGDIATFTTTASGTIVNTVRCDIADADWQTGTCKPGTAIE